MRRSSAESNRRWGYKPVAAKRRRPERLSAVEDAKVMMDHRHTYNTYVAAR